MWQHQHLKAVIIQQPSPDAGVDNDMPAAGPSTLEPPEQHLLSPEISTGDLTATASTSTLPNIASTSASADLSVDAPAQTTDLPVSAGTKLPYNMTVFAVGTSTLVAKKLRKVRSNKGKARGPNNKGKGRQIEDPGEQAEST